jgi:hypothetical protein
MGVARKSQAGAFNAPADAQESLRQSTAEVVGTVLVMQANSRPITCGTAPPTGLPFAGQHTAQAAGTSKMPGEPKRVQPSKDTDRKK